MARPRKYAAMSVATLIDLRDRVTQELAHRSKQLRAQLKHIGGYVSSSFRSGSRKASPAKRKSVPVTHRGPEKGQEWRGRGLPPKWLAALIRQGHSADEYRVGAKAVAAAKRPIAKKTSRGRTAKKRAKAK